MKRFKEYLKNDIDAVFLNNAEFAEEVEIDGQGMTVLIEEEQSKKFKNKDYDYGYSNHSEVNKIIALKESDYALLGSPERQERIVVNDVSYLILEIEKDEGMVNLKVQVYG